MLVQTFTTLILFLFAETRRPPRAKEVERRKRTRFTRMKGLYLDTNVRILLKIKT